LQQTLEYFMPWRAN